MKRSIFALSFVLVTGNLAAQGPPPQQDWGRNFFPPELVMQHQSEIGLQDSQRATLTSAIQGAQSKFMDTQWKLRAEGEKMGRLLQGTQVALMVRIKNTLPPQQQAKLAQIRG